MRIVIIDDEVKSKRQFKKLDKSEIFSIKKFAPEMAPPKYQTWNKDTLTIVKTKKVESKLQNERFQLLKSVLDSVDKGQSVTIIQNGLLVLPYMQKELRHLVPNQLSNAVLMEWEEAKKLYGSQAKPITLVINTY